MTTTGITSSPSASPPTPILRTSQLQPSPPPLLPVSSSSFISSSSSLPLPPVVEPESSQMQQQRNYAPLHRMTLELLYFKAISLYRRRNYEKCSEVCSAMLQTGHENNVQMFARNPDEDAGNETFDDNDDVDNDDDDGDDDVGDKAYSDNDRNRADGGGGGGDAGAGAGAGAGVGGRKSFKGTTASSSYALHSSNRYGSIPQHGNKLPPPRRQHGWHGNNNTRSNNNTSRQRNRSVMPTWMMEGIWQLKMRAITQRVYVDDLETNDDGMAETEEMEFERIATAARPGTSIKTAFMPRPSTMNTSSNINQRRIGARTAEGNSSGGQGRPQSARPTSGIARPGTALSRPGSSLVSNRSASRCATASRIRATSAAAYTVGDATAPLYQASRLNPTVYAERQVLVKALFQFLFYHESDIQKAYSLCEAVLNVARQKNLSRLNAATAGGARTSTDHVDSWWWDQQMGRCLLALRYPRKAEIYLQQSLATFPHPDTYLLLSRLYQRLEKPQQALDVINRAIERHPFDITFRTEQARLFEILSKPDDAIQMYRLINKLNPINIEALACIAVNYFYDIQPEMAVMYYRRILALGIYTAELYCNIGLCCLYGGQIDLVMPCFQRSLSMAKTAEQRADIWYNISFVALTSGDLNLTRRCLQLCLTSDPNNGAALNNLAVLAAHSGDLLKAKSYLNAAKEVLTDSYELENNLSYMAREYNL